MLLAMSLPEGCQSAERLRFRQLISGRVLSSLQLGARGNVNCSQPIARVTRLCLEHLHLSSDASVSENPSELLEGWGWGTVKIYTSAYRPKYGAEETLEQLGASPHICSNSF